MISLKSNFRLERAFPESSDFDKNRWFHAYHATEELIDVYGFDKDEPWQRNVPALLYQLGVAQAYMDVDEAIDKKLFTNGSFKFDLGRENSPAVQDIFKISASRKEKPIAPALLIDPNRLDGTSAPSYEASEKSMSLRGAGNIRDAEHAKRMQMRFKSPRTQPRFGEANNGKSSLFATFDPRVNSRSEAIIIVASEARGTMGQTRNRLHEHTRFDQRHDSGKFYDRLGLRGELVKLLDWDAKGAGSKTVTGIKFVAKPLRTSHETDIHDGLIMTSAQVILFQYTE